MKESAKPSFAAVAFLLLLAAVFSSANAAVTNVFIAFAEDPLEKGNIDIYTINPDKLWSIKPDGTDAKQLFQSPGNAMGIKFDPSGARIAYASDRDGNGWDLYISNLDGTNATLLTSGMHKDFSRSFHPSGRRIALNLMGTNYSGSIYSVLTNGSGLARLTDVESGRPGGWTPGGIFPVFKGDITPVYSPDGQKIAYCSDQDGKYDVYVINADGTNKTKITSGAGEHISLAWQAVQGMPSGTGRSLGLANWKTMGMAVAMALVSIGQYL